MSRGRVTKSVRAYMGVITAEGGKVLDLRVSHKHPRIEYTFDGEATHTTVVPNGVPTDRHLLNFRAQIRRTKPQGT